MSMGSRQLVESGLRGLLAAPVVTVSGRAWAGRDLVTAGVISGRWRELEDELAAGIAARGEWAPPAEAVDAGLREFRHARRLVSAAEFVAWMDKRELTQADLRAAVERRLARDHEADRPRADRALERDAAIAALPAEAVYSGALLECSRWLIDRVLCLQLGEGTAPRDDEIDAILASERGLLAAGVTPGPENERRDRASLLLSADAAHDSHADEVASPSAVSSHLRRHGLDWLRFEIRSFESQVAGQAAEVAALMKEGTGPGRISELSGLPVGSARLYLEDAPEALQVELAGATVGSVLGPARDGDVYRTWLVEARRAPDASEPEIAARVRAEILEEDMHRRRAGEVRWHDRH
jgi:hypothetical protein